MNDYDKCYVIVKGNFNKNLITIELKEEALKTKKERFIKDLISLKTDSDFNLTSLANYIIYISKEYQKKNNQSY